MRVGHKWWAMADLPLPIQFCARWGCDGERVNPDFVMDPEVRDLFERYVSSRMRQER